MVSINVGSFIAAAIHVFIKSSDILIRSKPFLAELLKNISENELQITALIPYWSNGP